MLNIDESAAREGQLVGDSFCFSPEGTLKKLSLNSEADVDIELRKAANVDEKTEICKCAHCRHGGLVGRNVT